MQENFPIRTGETAFLFLQHFIKILKAGGKGAVVIKNTFLSNSDNASKALRKELLTSCDLHTILDYPGGTFIGAGVKTVVLFFEKGAPTRKIWYYQLDPGRNMGKTNPLNDGDLKEFLELQSTFAVSEKSWPVDVKDVDESTFDLSVKNPNVPEEDPIRSPEEILDDLERMEDSLGAKALLGFITELREEKGCYVVLLFNEGEIKKNDEIKRAVEEYREKVIDREFAFSPTVEDSARIVFGNELDKWIEGTSIQITFGFYGASDDINLLGLLEADDTRNIRVLKRIKACLQDLKKNLPEKYGELWPTIARQAVKLCILHYEYGKDLDFEYIRS